MASLVLDPLVSYPAFPVAEMQARAVAFYIDLKRRRTVRDFSDTPVPRQVVEQALLAAGTASSGANLQPWHFTVIESPQLKQRVRDAADAE